MRKTETKYKTIRTCPMCSKETEVYFKSAEDMAAYGKNGFTQFGYMNASQREALISGICDECWDNAFPEEEED